MNYRYVIGFLIVCVAAALWVVLGKTAYVIGCCIMAVVAWYLFAKEDARGP
jgi:hypothetical protein